MQPVFRGLVVLGVASLLMAPQAVWAQAGDAGNRLAIDHRYANTDAQSLIGLPMGSHKTTVEKNGWLRWSQWSLKRRPLDAPIGFSAQMDGMLAIEPFTVSAGNETALQPGAQTLYRGRYPFVVSQFAGGTVRLEELPVSIDITLAPAIVAAGELSHRVTFEFTVTSAGGAGR